MRLVCPNCEARYEVPDSAIPEHGRDVQCTNCGHGWFQTGQEAPVADPGPQQEDKPAPGVMAGGPGLAEAPVATPVNADPQRDEPAADPGLTVAPSDVAVAARHRNPDGEVTVEDPPQKEGPDPADTPPAPTYVVDDSVLAILREEAEREALARQTERRAALGQPPAKRTKAARSKPDVTAPQPVEKPAARRDLLPDVEEINSTLRPSGAPGDSRPDAAVPGQDRRRGFAGGFLSVIAVTILALGLYLLAPRVVAILPGTAAPLDAYVATVDGLRLWIDGVRRTASETLGNP